MADVTIGGQGWAVTLPHFKKLKAAWRYIAAVQGADDPLAGADALLRLGSVGAHSPLSPEELEEALTPAEMPALRSFINALMIEIGLAPGASDSVPLAEAARPSMATSTPSSAPSSPDSAQPTGTA